MFHSRNFKPQKSQQRNSLLKQGGGALVVAIFIIVVMSILGIAMVRILGDLSRATVSEVYGARAYAAARSGAEIFLTDLFPFDQPVATSECSSVSYSFTADGLNQCSVNIDCVAYTIPAPFSGQHFRITAEGVCSIAATNYSKRIILEATDGVF